MVPIKTLVKEHIKEKYIIKATTNVKVPVFSTKLVPISIHVYNKLY